MRKNGAWGDELDEADDGRLPAKRKRLTSEIPEAEGDDGVPGAEADDGVPGAADDDDTRSRRVEVRMPSRRINPFRRGKKELGDGRGWRRVIVNIHRELLRCLGNISVENRV